MTRIAIVGAGANGASIGADLIAAGRDVTLVEQWPAHVAAMREQGSGSRWRIASCASSRRWRTCAKSRSCGIRSMWS